MSRAGMQPPADSARSAADRTTAAHRNQRPMPTTTASHHFRRVHRNVHRLFAAAPPASSVTTAIVGLALATAYIHLGLGGLLFTLERPRLRRPRRPDRDRRRRPDADRPALQLVPARRPRRLHRHDDRRLPGHGPVLHPRLHRQGHRGRAARRPGRRRGPRLRQPDGPRPQPPSPRSPRSSRCRRASARWPPDPSLIGRWVRRGPPAHLVNGASATHEADPPPPSSPSPWPPSSRPAGRRPPAASSDQPTTGPTSPSPPPTWLSTLAPSPSPPRASRSPSPS